MKKIRIKQVPLAYVTEVVEKAETREINPPAERSSGKVPMIRTPKLTKNRKSRVAAIIRPTKTVAEDL